MAQVRLRVFLSAEAEDQAGLMELMRLHLFPVVLVAHMVGAVVLALPGLVVAVLPQNKQVVMGVLAQSVLFGLAQLAASHQQMQAIYN